MEGNAPYSPPRLGLFPRAHHLRRYVVWGEKDQCLRLAIPDRASPAPPAPQDDRRSRPYYTADVLPQHFSGYGNCTSTHGVATPKLMFDRDDERDILHVITTITHINGRGEILMRSY